MNAPYDNLTPDMVLNAVDSLGLVTDGHLLTLNSYENRVYQVGVEEASPLIAKFYRPARWSDAAILEEHTFSGELAEAELPVVAPLSIHDKTLHEFGGYRFSVFSRQGGRAPEFDDLDTLEWMGRFIGRIHAIGAQTLYAHRSSIDPNTYGVAARDYLLANNVVPVDMRSVYNGVAQQALDGVARCYERAGDLANLRLHGDCHVGNVLWTDKGPHFVDFDDSRMGPAVQDLWMLLSGDRARMNLQLDAVLAGYEAFWDFNPRELYIVEALRTLRLIHYSAWIAQRWSDPAFPVAFPWFEQARYWQDRVLELREQIAAMDELPAGVGGMFDSDP